MFNALNIKFIPTVKSEASNFCEALRIYEQNTEFEGIFKSNT